MKDNPPLVRLLLGALVLATVLYVSGFALNEHLRSRHGPWQVTFDVTPAGQPQIRIRQAALGIQDVTITFADEHIDPIPPHTVRFEAPRTPVPFGMVKYDDLTYLPGVVTFDVFGHEIELLPRVLYLNRRPLPWAKVTNIVLRTVNRRAETVRAVSQRPAVPEPTLP